MHPRPERISRSFLDRKDGTLGALQTPDGTIAVDPDDQNISEGLRLLQVTDMADVKEVETAVGKDNPFALFLQVVDDPLKLFSCLDFFFHLLKRTRFEPLESNASGARKQNRRSS